MAIRNEDHDASYCKKLYFERDVNDFGCAVLVVCTFCECWVETPDPDALYGECRVEEGRPG